MLQSKIQCMVKMKQWPDFFVPNRFQKNIGCSSENFRHILTFRLEMCDFYLDAKKGFKPIPCIHFWVYAIFPLVDVNSHVAGCSSRRPNCSH